jgi:hypothetical protein
MIILKLFFGIFLIGIIAVIFFVLRIVLTVRKAHEHFRQSTTKTGGRRPTGTTTTGPDGERITDTRDPEKARRKIISDDEGEYVDFVEE